MSIENGIIIKPVSIADVQTATGCHSKNDVGGLCTSDAINKWAKYKPVSRPVLRPLTEEERKGTGGTGEYYGLQCTLTQITISPELHNVGFEYIRPTGGISSPYRLSDFDGYDHAAEPDPTGEINARDVYWQDEIRNGEYYLDIYIRHYRWKGTGVSLDDIIGQLNGFGDVKENIHFCYPMILLGSSVRCLQNKAKTDLIVNDPEKYCTTLGELQTQSATGKSVTVDGRTVIIDGRVWWDRVESVKVNGIDRTGTIVTVTGDSVKVEVKVYGFYDSWRVPIDLLSLGLAPRKEKATIFLLYPNSPEERSFVNSCKTEWQPVSSQQQHTYRPFPIPGGIGIDLNIDRHIGPSLDVKLWKNNADTAAVGLKFTAIINRPTADSDRVIPNTNYTILGRVWFGDKPESGIFGGSFSVTVNSGDRMQATEVPGLIQFATVWHEVCYSWANIEGRDGSFNIYPPNNKSTLYYEWNCVRNGVTLSSGSGSIYIGPFSGSL